MPTTVAIYKATLSKMLNSISTCTDTVLYSHSVRDCSVIAYIDKLPQLLMISTCLNGESLFLPHLYRLTL